MQRALCNPTLERSIRLGEGLDPQTFPPGSGKGCSRALPSPPESSGCRRTMLSVPCLALPPLSHPCQQPRSRWGSFLCSYLRGEGLARQLVLCRCRRRRPWAGPCAASSVPCPSEVPSSGFIWEVPRLQDQHTYRERPTLAARRWRTPLNVIFLKCFLTQQELGAPLLSVEASVGKEVGSPAAIREESAGIWAGTERGKWEFNARRWAFLLATPISFPRGNPHFGFVMWVSYMGGGRFGATDQCEQPVRSESSPCSPGCRHDTP